MRPRASILFGLALAAAACTGGNGNGRTPPDPTVKVDGGGPAGPGWKLAGKHGREGEGCRQMWTCECAPAAPGCKIQKPSDASTVGLCAADEGPHSACTRCLALEPAEACACKSVCP